MANQSSSYAYNNWDSEPDPPHQPLYLNAMLCELRRADHIRTILDAGCGDGNFSASLAEHGYQIYGLDMSESGVQRAQQRGSGQYVQASMYDDLLAPFKISDGFDAIIAVETVEHLYSPVTFAARAYEALKPGGLLIVTTPYWGYAKNILLAVTNRMDRNLTPLWEGGHIKHWSKDTMTTLLSNAGFSRARFTGCGRFAPFWRGMMMCAERPASSSQA